MFAASALNLFPWFDRRLQQLRPVSSSMLPAGTIGKVQATAVVMAVHLLKDGKLFDPKPELQRTRSKPFLSRTLAKGIVPGTVWLADYTTAAKEVCIVVIGIRHQASN